MTRLPVPDKALTDGLRETAELTARAAKLTDHGLRLAFGTLIGYADPSTGLPVVAVREAVIAALGGAEAGEGLTGEPPQPERQPGTVLRLAATHSAWHGEGDLWERDGDGTFAECSWFAAVNGGAGGGYFVLPLGEKPGRDGAE